MMTSDFGASANPVLTRIRKVIAVKAFHPPPLRPLFEPDGRRLTVPMTDLIAEVERKLGVPMPPWLREIYRHCNGFTGPYGRDVLYRLDGSQGVVEFTLAIRAQDWAPPWLSRAIIFGATGGTGSMTTHTVALDGQLVMWCYGDGEKFTVPEGDLFDVWDRIGR
jgi:SMI1/KNR4 family protein SUKH-1